ncbi:hypothetical protein E2C01_043877 [Portunus trituberculatus]|uniref:Uncharacterized protein n=1 Tax=Portunus trituberculatus TaxID=210409 RepID=A0A5B7FXJ2_PORTR|nr:hypothetical protein [Portunus trituberculatus]
MNCTCTRLSVDSWNRPDDLTDLQNPNFIPNPYSSPLCLPSPSVSQQCQGGRLAAPPPPLPPHSAPALVASFQTIFHGISNIGPRELYEGRVGLPRQPFVLVGLE